MKNGMIISEENIQFLSDCKTQCNTLLQPTHSLPKAEASVATP